MRHFRFLARVAQRKNSDESAVVFFFVSEDTTVFSPYLNAFFRPKMNGAPAIDFLARFAQPVHYFLLPSRSAHPRHRPVVTMAADPERCPKCKKYGDWSAGRGLAAHLRRCTGPILWDQFSVGQESNKRMREERTTAQPTGAQTLRQIDAQMHAAHASGTDRAANPLASMPSLGALASSWNDESDKEYNFMDFGGFHDDDFDDEDGENEASADNNAVQWSGDDHNEQVDLQSGTLEVESHIVNGKEVLVELNPFRRRANLPNGVVYQLHMMNILNSHRQIDLNLFSEINDCVKYHAQEHKVDFATTKMYNRDELVRISTEVYNLHGMKPKLNRVKLSDNTEAVVPSFDVKTMLLSILNDPTRMRWENIASNYDPFTGRPINPVTHIDEIHTGWAWEDAREHYCGDDPDVFPLGLVCFYDKTHSDLFGSLACAPFICVPTFFNLECRCNTDFWVTLGYVPNLGHGKGKANQQDTRDKLQDQHNCIKVITDQIAELRDKGYFWTKIFGRIVKVVVWIHFITGDTSGHNDLCGKYNSNGVTNCAYRCCMCGLSRPIDPSCTLIPPAVAAEASMASLSDPVAQCHLISLAMVAQVAQAPGGLHTLSLHNIVNAFINVPLSDLVNGIFGICPAETLHVLGNGIIKYMFRCIIELVGPGQSRMAEKDLFDALHENLVRDAARQSDRDFPRMTVRCGFGDGTKMAAFEAFGNLLIQLCVSYTDSGLDLLRDGMARENISQKDYRHCIKLLLAFDRWCHQSNPKEEVEQSVELLGELIELIQRCFPRVDGNGWEIPKIHSLAKMVYYMLKFGCAKGVSGQTGERALKQIVKDHSTQTQRRANVFTEQVATRQYEAEVLGYAFKDIRPLLGLDYELVDNADPNMWESEGRFTMWFEPCDHRERGPVRITWADRRKDRLQIGVSRAFRYTIRKFAVRHGWTGTFEVEGYTRFAMNFADCEARVNFHASEYLMGSSWYDHAMIQFVEEGKSLTETVCPARVLGFFRYASPGVPTPHLIEDEGMTADEIADNWSADNHVYAVVHAASAYLPWSRIENEFVSPFKFGRADSCIYIVKAESIIDPLFVFGNYGGKGANKDKYYCVLPRRKWAQYFSSRINTS